MASPTAAVTSILDGPQESVMVEGSFILLLHFCVFVCCDMNGAFPSVFRYTLNWYSVITKSDVYRAGTSQVLFYT